MMVKIIIPLKMRKDGRGPWKRQKPVYLSVNLKLIAIKRGIPVKVPDWALEVCDCAGIEYYKSNQQE